MTTRLDRLFLLLDTGSTPLIRRSAAEQLGDVQKLHPYELNNLLNKVHQYLCSSNWDTRIAASQAIHAIAKNVPQWEPRGAPKRESGTEVPQLDGKLLFSQFDLQKVLQNGASLLGSEGDQFNSDERFTGMDESQKLLYQRQLLNKRLGLDMAGNLKLGLETDLFTDEDLLTGMSKEQTEVKHEQQTVGLMYQQQMCSGLSARERNRAKRKAKLMAKQSSRDSPVPDNENEPPLKRLKSEPGTARLDPEPSMDVNDEDDWPFEWICEQLMGDLFHSSWEQRHGAATGLRDIIKLHGRGAGKSMDTPSDQLFAMNQLYLSDLALRLLCVIALDRFGDFVSDEVVAPVRESCAQTLGVVMKYLDTTGIHGVVSILLKLLAQERWEVRHGGLLGIKYLLAVRGDMTKDLLPSVLPFIYRGLQDVDDDVRAVAASALVPVADTLVQILPQQVSLIVMCLWEILLDLDDLTASTNSIMTLLATLLAHPGASVLENLVKPLTELVPRLWPFLRHNITSVRRSALETLITLVNMPSKQHPVSAWLPPILQSLLRHIYQRVLLESHPDLLHVVTRLWTSLLDKAPSEFLTTAATPWLGVWLSLAMQPSKIPYEHNYLIEAKHRGRVDSSSHKGRQSTDQEDTACNGQDHSDYIAGADTVNAPVYERDVCVSRARMNAAKMLGALCSKLCSQVSNLPPEYDKPQDSLAKLMVFHLNTKSAIQRFIVAEVLETWAQTQAAECEEIRTKTLETLCETIYFDEIALGFTRMQTECKDFIASLKVQGINMDQVVAPGSILSLDQAQLLVTQVFDQVKTAIKPRNLQLLEDRRSQLHASINQISADQQLMAVRTQSSLAKAVVALDAIPDKLNPVVRPLMDCIKKEENVNIQRESARCLSVLLQKLLTRDPCPNNKVVKNLCGFVCCDPTVTPLISQLNNNSSETSCDMYKGNLTLAKLNKVPEQESRRGLRRVPSIKNDVGVSNDILQEDSQTQKQLSTQRKGGEITMCTATSHFGDKLPEHLPALWETVTRHLQNTAPDELTETSAQDVVNSLQVLETIGPSLHDSLVPKFLDCLPCLKVYMKNSYTGVRHMASRCVAMLATLCPLTVMAFVIESVLPMLQASDDDTQRQGASEVMANVVDRLELDIIPYIVLLIVPILGRMTDRHSDIRIVATHCFATLIRLLPLEAGVPDPPDMKLSLVESKKRERVFLEQLMDSSKLENYTIDVPIRAELRKYQQDGVNWLGFLNKYKLHGVLCDDMGLGKTLQSICIIATDHYRRDCKYKETESTDCSPLPSIVVCPPTLIGHWVYEVNKFIDKEYLNPLMYAGTPADRLRLQKKVKKHNMIVASYDVVRNDIDFFGNINWNYCVLDEGHIIKNGKTKISKAVKQLNCNHRLVLSGTPIQNNVLDLWSLFDFLVPGFLGTEKQFQARYGKPILASREAKSSSKEQEAGALAMETLHRQVLPFILRRLKEDVLQDLPPKIIQDYYCDLSPLQVKLYEDFSKSQAQKGVEDCVQSGKEPGKKGSTHVFQALQYLRKVCNHPALVLSITHPKYAEVTAYLKAQNSSLHELSHAPKLTALRQLLLDCGIGVEDAASGLLGTEAPVVNQHRVLLFCQLKGMLDIVEKDLLKLQMPSVTYLRLDGSVPAGSRHDIVNRFNNDPSIDLLLLTTHVGGLGLNLTGADTVIFVEHDWNPMKDLQAMDRAHRIGQKKVVNVYRLVTRGTLEEKIMGLQKFKMTIANTVISQDNSSLGSMGTDQLLDLFALEDKKKGESSTSSKTQTDKKETIKSILDGIGELWKESQYENEYDMGSFMQSLV